MSADEPNPRPAGSADRMTLFERVASLVTLAGGGIILYGIIDPNGSSAVLLGGLSTFFAGVLSLVLAGRRRSR